jgi:hypothetical protein
MDMDRTVNILVRLGVREDTAASMVRTAQNMGKHTGLALLPGTNGWTAITVHHGMRGNITHLFTVEIS